MNTSEYKWLQKKNVNLKTESIYNSKKTFNR